MDKIFKHTDLLNYTASEGCEEFGISFDVVMIYLFKLFLFQATLILPAAIYMSIFLVMSQMDKNSWVNRKIFIWKSNAIFFNIPLRFGVETMLPFLIILFNNVKAVIDPPD